MHIKTINDFVKEVLSFHPSRSSPSNLLLPNVLLERLTDNTIEQYTGMKDRLDDESSKDSKDDLTDSSSSDELPDLNDPSWTETKVKNQEFKRKRKKDTHKTDPQLMKKARQIYQTQASRYKSSQEFMKNSKSYLVQKSTSDSNISFPRAPLQSLNNENLSSPNEAASVQTQETYERDNERGFTKTEDEIMLERKLREAIERQVGERRKNGMDLQKQSLFTTNAVTDDENLVEIESEDSNSSNCTVPFKENEVSDDMDMLSNNNNSNDVDVFKLSPETTNKRKDTPFENKNDFETNKKQKENDGQSMVTESVVNKRPMVVIPYSTSSSTILPAVVATSVPAIITTTAPSFVLTSIPTPSLLDVPSQTEIESDRNDPKINNTLNENLLVTSSVPRDDQENENTNLNSLDNVMVMPITSNNISSENLHNSPTNSVKESVVSTEFSFIKLQELTLKRIDYEEKITQLKEEYRKKLEPLEKGLKSVDDEVKKLMILKSKSEAKEQITYNEQEQGAIISTPDTSVKEIATAVSHGTGSQNEGNRTLVIPGAEKTLINIIPAASIKNFGGNKTQNVRVVKKRSILPKEKSSAADGDASSPKLDKNQYTRIPLQVLRGTSKESNVCPPTTQYSSLVEQEAPPNIMLRSTQQQPPLASNRVPVQVAVTSVTSPSVCPPPVVQYSSLDSQPPPNVTVRSIQQPQTLTSSHSSNITAHVTPSAIQESQSQDPVPHKFVSSLRNVRKNNAVISDNQQNQNIPVQMQTNTSLLQMHLQQQQEQQQGPQLIRIVTNPQQQLPTIYIPYRNATFPQQQSSISQPHVQQYQSVQGQQPQQMQGHVVGGTYHSPAGSTSDCSNTSQINNAPHKALIPTSFQVNTATQNTNNTSIQKQTSIITFNQGSKFSQVSKPVHSVTGNRVFTGPSHPSVSHPTTAGINNDNINIITPSNVNKSVVTESESLSTVETNATVNLSQPVENQPVCVKCGSEGIFTCCNGVVYCSTTCQGNDWETHQMICTNSNTGPEV